VHLKVARILVIAKFPVRPRTSKDFAGSAAPKNKQDYREMLRKEKQSALRAQKLPKLFNSLPEKHSAAHNRIVKNRSRVIVSDRRLTTNCDGWAVRGRGSTGVMEGKLHTSATTGFAAAPFNAASVFR
jgi:hypothetical protein